MCKSRISTLKNLFIFLWLFFFSLSQAQAATFTEEIIDNDGPLNMHTKTVADFDGDGVLNPVVAGTEGAIYWYKKSGTSWQRNVITSGGLGKWSTDAEAADIDNDGDDDLVVSDWYQNERLGWFENLNAGQSFTFHVIGTPKAHDIEVADFNGDGKIDIVTRNQGSKGNVLDLWIQNNPFSFSHSTISTPTGEGLHVVDIDKDNAPDIVAGPYLYRNEGGNTFSSKKFAANWTDPDTITVSGDVNGDGRLDLLLSPSEHAGSNYHLSWFEAPANPMTGTWVEHLVVNQLETSAHALQTADFNSDGKLDIAYAEMEQSSNPDEVVVLYNQDNGQTFTKEVLSNLGSHSIRAADLDGDNDPDLFGANWKDDKNVKVWINENQKTKLSLDDFSYIQVDNSRSKFDSKNAFLGLASADCTGDGYEDIVSGKYFYANPGGDMTSTWPRTTFPINADALLTLDIDGDSNLDVIAQALPDVYWLEAQNSACSSWSVTAIGTLPPSSHVNAQGYTTAQLVAGGKPEIVLASGAGAYYFEIPANPENGNWPKTYIGGNSEEGIGTGDINGDGLVDVAAAIDKGTGRPAFFINPGDGTANWQMVELPTHSSAYLDRFYVKDINQDGRNDIAISVANGSANGAYVYYAPADPVNGTWNVQTVATLDSANSMDAADMDGDGDIDLTPAEHFGAERVIIYENIDKGSSWVAHQVDSGKESHLGSRVFDLDNDGDLDIVSIGWSDYQYLHLWRNDALTGSSGSVQAPSFDPPGGTFSGPVSVTISTTTSGAEIRYTTDGSEPTQSSTLYTDPVFIQVDTTLRAKGFRSDLDSSPTTTDFYVIESDTTAPYIETAYAINETLVAVRFSEEVEVNSAETVSNYDIAPGVNVLAASLSADQETVVLDTSLLSEDTTYTLTVSNVEDLSGNVIEPGSTFIFTFSSVFLPDGLIAYWPFDEVSGSVANDLSGNGNFGTLKNGASFSAGFLNNGVLFDGVNDLVDIGSLDLAPDAMSISVHLFSDNLANCSSANDCRIISKATGTAENQHYWMLSTIKDGTETKPRLRLKTAGTTKTFIPTDGALSESTWQHIAVTYDGSTVRMYLDAIELSLADASKSGAINTDSSVAATIAINPDNYGAFKGLIDEVRLYDRALTSDEVEQLKDPPPPGDTGETPVITGPDKFVFDGSDPNPQTFSVFGDFFEPDSKVFVLLRIKGQEILNEFKDVTFVSKTELEMTFQSPRKGTVHLILQNPDGSGGVLESDPHRLKLLVQ